MTMLQRIVDQKKISKYRLSKNSGIPYTTLTDILSGKADIKKCSADTIYRLAKELGITMEALLAPYYEVRSNFELFKSNVCHSLKEQGDIDFILDTLEKDDIQRYYDLEWYPESFYMLAMLDYISRVNDVPLCDRYASMRRQSLAEPLYPASVIAMDAVSASGNAKAQARAQAIPEFMRFNIVESEVRNVI